MGVRSVVCGAVCSLFVVVVVWAGDPAIQAKSQVPWRPNPKVTPGDVCDAHDPDFDRLRYLEKIFYCHRNVDLSHRKAIYEQYGIPVQCRQNFTIDHFIPLSLGGNNSPSNLWPEHKQIKALRMNLENDLHLQMERAAITQDEAIKKIVAAKMSPPQQAHLVVDPCFK